MALYKTQGIVLGRRALGESDRLVDFYTRDHGRVRGVAKSARRTRSRFGSALELFTLGELCFFDTGRSELVRVDHFDIIHPFVRVREHLERLGQGAWVIECLTRLTPDRDPQPALFGLTLRSLRALDAGARPQRVASCFALRAVDLLGHRPRIDRCVECGRAYPFPEAALDMTAGGLLCARCGAGADALPLSGPAVGLLKRLRALAWEEGLRLPLAADLDAELAATLEGVMTRLMGHLPRSSRFLAQTRRGLSHHPSPSPLP
jgi:DNA repair protein RecO (recombination protein O)